MSGTDAPQGEPRSWVRCACLTVLGLALGVILVWALFLGVMFKAAGVDRSQDDVLATVARVGAAQITSEARALLAEHEPGTTLSGPNHGGKVPLPAGLAQLEPIYVLVGEDSVRIKIWGMGDWAGLVVVQPGETLEYAELVGEDLYWLDPSQGPK